MKALDYKNEALFEHRFWLQVLGDHSRFIMDALSPEETIKIQCAQYFIHLFDGLLAKARMDLSESEINELNTLAYNAAHEIRMFKLSIIYEHIADKVKIHLSPTFINHMVNELDEYVLILSCIMNKKIQLSNPVHHHLLWLSDASGHASGISSLLDMSEKDLIKLSMKFTKKFDHLYLKSIEYQGYMRTGLFNFSALHRLNTDADCEIESFKQFLVNLEKLILDKKLLGQLMPLMTDHMFREECYYQTKLSKVTEVPPPKCDPTKPRIES